MKLKKNELTFDELLEKCLREVRVLSKTNHPNVLRYYGCWFEVVYEQSKSELRKKSSKIFDQDSMSGSFEIQVFDDTGNQLKEEDNHLFLKPTIDKSKNKLSDNQIDQINLPQDNFYNSNKFLDLLKDDVFSNHNEVQKPVKIAMPQPRKSKIDHFGKLPFEHFKTPPAIIQKDYKEQKIESIKALKLFIQTEKLEFTLDHYLQKRNACEQHQEKPFLLENFHICEQIIRSIEYIHDTLMTVHRDIKPSNIFMNQNLELKLGDFGLIKPIVSLSQSTEENQPEYVKRPIRKISDDILTVSSQPWSNSNSGACGTHNYASPEQLSDSTQKYIDFKSDIYSLGIVFFQLFHVMETQMEQYKTIKDCRNATLPKEFQEKYHEISQLILQMIHPIPNIRPNIQVVNQTMNHIRQKYILQFTNNFKVQVKFENDHDWHKKIVQKTICFYESEKQVKTHKILPLDFFQISQSEHMILLKSEIHEDCMIMTQSSEEHIHVYQQITLTS